MSPQDSSGVVALLLAIVLVVVVAGVVWIIVNQWRTPVPAPSDEARLEITVPQ